MAKSSEGFHTMCSVTDQHALRRMEFCVASAVCVGPNVYCSGLQFSTAICQAQVRVPVVTSWTLVSIMLVQLGVQN